MKCPKDALFFTAHPIMTHKKNIHSLKEIPPPSQSILALYLHTGANGITNRTQNTHGSKKNTVKQETCQIFYDNVDIFCVCFYFTNSKFDKLRK